MIWFFTQDITDVIKNRDELRELNYLMDAILNNIPVYLFVKDLRMISDIFIGIRRLPVTLKFLLPKRWGVLI